MGLNDNPVTVTYFIMNFCIVLVAIAVILLNALVIHVIRCQWSTLDVCYLFILNLAIGDLLTGVIFIYTVFYNLVIFTFLYECLFRFGLILMIVNSTSLHFAILTLDRVIVIAYPYRHSGILSRKRAIWIIVSIWVYSFISSMTSLLGWYKEQRHGYCQFFEVLPKSYLALHMTVLIIVIGAVLVLYLYLYRISRRHAVAIAVQQGITSVTGVNFDLKHAWKFTKTAILLFGAFFICWMPTSKISKIYNMLSNKPCPRRIM